MSLFRLLLIFALCAVVAACGSTPSTRAEYEKAGLTPPLDLPPALDVPEAGPEGLNLPKRSSGQPGTLLPASQGVQVMHAGHMRWLLVRQSVEDLWPKVHEFWKKAGIKIAKEDARIGLIETRWREDRTKVRKSTVSTRDKYRMRLERGREPGTTEIYLSHYGAGKIRNGKRVRWESRPSDPERAAEMLSRMMLFLGVEEKSARQALAEKPKSVSTTRLAGDKLILDDGFARAWRLTGMALDRVGLVVEDLDRTKGLYFVRKTDSFVEPGGGKSSNKRYRLHLQGNDNSSRLTVLNERGKRVSAKVARPILSAVREQLP